MSDHDFDDLMTALDPPMVIVTAGHAHEHGGCLVGFHAQSGIEPGTISVWLSKANHTFRVAVFAEHLAVHFLSVDDLELATAFGTTSGDDVDKFAGRSWQPGPGGVPLLDECANRIVGRKMALLDARSDHVCVVLDPVETEHVPPFRPLRLSAVSHLRAGHEVEERPTPASTRSGPDAHRDG